MTWREITPEQLNKLKNSLILDVRSPCEHAVESIPGSINMPLLSDAERVEVGTMYKQQGDLVARRYALTLISPKIPSFIEQVAALRQHGQTIVVHCWRGGLRSEAVSSVLSIAGIDCFRLTGGYKAWRAAIVRDLEEDAFPFDAMVLVGLTGTGKTELLQALKQEGLQVLDLEALANHRGSIFGGIGLGDQPSQKDFEARLWNELRQLKPGPVFLEGESRKIGKLAVPDCVFDRIQNGQHVLVTGSVEARARRIAADYLNPARNPEAEMAHAIELLGFLKERLGNAAINELRELLESGRIQEATERILVDYYDPLYNRQIEKCSPFAFELDSDDVASGVAALINWTKAVA